jgi:hypothetical protein
VTQLLKLLALLILTPITLIASLLFIRTEQGRIGWFVLEPGQVIIDGEHTSGYLHLERSQRLLLLSRTDELRPITYLISLGATRLAIDCADWSPGRWWVVAMGGDVNPPCFWASGERDPILFPTLKKGPSFVEFWTRSGKKVRAQWGN